MSKKACRSTTWPTCRRSGFRPRFMKTIWSSCRSIRRISRPAMTSDRLPVVATTRAFADEPFYGTLAFVYPHVDQDTRTVSVRFELKNPGHKLRPGSTATVTIKVAAAKACRCSPASPRLAAPRPRCSNKGRVLAVPETAVIDTGSQTIVYRETSPGVFEGVRVQLGPRMTGPARCHLVSGTVRIECRATKWSRPARSWSTPKRGSIRRQARSTSAAAAVRKRRSSVTNVRPSTPDDNDAKVAAALAKLAGSRPQIGRVAAASAR